MRSSWACVGGGTEARGTEIGGRGWGGERGGKNDGVGSHALLRGIFVTQESNPGLLHCRWILCHLSHQGSPSHRDTIFGP